MIVFATPIAPHGAGGTNMLFMPTNSIYIEILSKDQAGRVYGTLAKMLGHRYVACIYDRALPRFHPQMLKYTPSTDNFVLDVPWFLGCLSSKLNSTRGTPDSPWSEQAWKSLDFLLGMPPVSKTLKKTSAKGSKLKLQSQFKYRPRSTALKRRARDVTHHT